MATLPNSKRAIQEEFPPHRYFYWALIRLLYRKKIRCVWLTAEDEIAGKVKMAAKEGKKANERYNKKKKREKEEQTDQ